MKNCWHARYSRAFSFELLGSYLYTCRAEAVPPRLRRTPRQDLNGVQWATARTAERAAVRLVCVRSSADVTLGDDATSIGSSDRGMCSRLACCIAAWARRTNVSCALFRDREVGLAQARGGDPEEPAVLVAGIGLSSLASQDPYCVSSRMRGTVASPGIAIAPLPRSRT